MAARPTLSGEQSRDGPLASAGGHQGRGRRRPCRDRQDVRARRGARGVVRLLAMRCWAPPSRAAQRVELQADAGIPSTSVTALLASLRSETAAAVCVARRRRGGHGRDSPARSARSTTCSGPTGKLVLVGDHRQLPELEAGGAFRGLVRRGLAIELTREPPPGRAVGARGASIICATAASRRRCAALRGARPAARRSPTDDETRERLVRTGGGAGPGRDAVMIARGAPTSPISTPAPASSMRAAGAARAAELRARLAGAFAVGDRVVVKRNDLRARRHQRRARPVVDVDLGTRLAGVDVRDGRRVRLDRASCGADPGRRPDARARLRDHRARRPGPDGRPRLRAGRRRASQEWGYTALTRGRDAITSTWRKGRRRGTSSLRAGLRATRWRSSSATSAQAARSRSRLTQSMTSSPASQSALGGKVPKTSGPVRHEGPWPSTACAGCPAAAARPSPRRRRGGRCTAFG